MKLLPRSLQNLTVNLADNYLDNDDKKKLKNDL